MSERRIIWLTLGEKQAIDDDVSLCVVKLRRGAASIGVDVPVWMGVELAEKAARKRGGERR